MESQVFPEQEIIIVVSIMSFILSLVERPGFVGRYSAFVTYGLERRVWMNLGATGEVCLVEIEGCFQSWFSPSSKSKSLRHLPVFPHNAAAFANASLFPELPRYQNA